MCTAQPQKRPSNILLFLTGQLRFNKWQSTSPPPPCHLFTSQAGQSLFLSCASLIVSEVGSVLLYLWSWIAQAVLFARDLSGPLIFLYDTEKLSPILHVRLLPNFLSVTGTEKTCVPTIETIQSSGNQQVYSVGGWCRRISHFSNQKTGRTVIKLV